MVLLIDLPADIVRCVMDRIDTIDRFVLRRVCKRFFSLIPPCMHSKQLYQSVVCGGNVHVFRWLESHIGMPSSMTRRYDATLCVLAANNGRLEMLQFLRQSGYDWDARASAYAARNNHRNILEWMYDTSPPPPHLPLWSPMTCADAAFGGHFALLKWLHSIDCQWDEETTRWAAFRGRIDMLQWLHENNCPCNAIACAAASRSGQLATLQWLRNNHCQWDVWAGVEAARGGHLIVLQWMYAHETIDWDVEWLELAAKHYNQHHVVEWLRSIESS